MGSMSLIQGNMRRALFDEKPLYKVQKEIYCSEFSSIFQCTDSTGNILFIYVVVGEPESQSTTQQIVYKNNLQEAFEKCEDIIRKEYGLVSTFSMRNVNPEKYRHCAEDGKDYFFFEIHENILATYRAVNIPATETNKHRKILHGLVVAAGIFAFVVAVYFAVLFFLGNSTKSISIHSISQQVWYIGDELSSDDISLKVTDNLGRERLIEDGFYVESTRFNTPGVYEIIIEYENKSTTLMLNVSEAEKERETDDIDNVSDELKTAVSFSLVTEALKNTYFVNEILDTNGISLLIQYNDGTTQMVTDGFVCSPMLLTSVGNQKVTVSYEGMTTEFDVVVNDVTVDSVDLKNKPLKTTYFINEPLSIDGLVLMIQYSDGTTKMVTDGYTCTPTQLTSAGNQRITVSYGGKTVDFNVTVEAVELESISLKTKPSKSSYFVNEPLSTAGLSLQARYSDGTIKTITDGFSCTPTQLTSVGNQKITVSYGAKTVGFDVMVKAVTLESISLKTKPSKTTYFVDELLNIAGLSLQIRYSDGTTKMVTDGYTCTPTQLTFAGNQKVTVSYGGKIVEFDVTVKEVLPTAIKVLNLPHKTTYTLGEYLDTNGMLMQVSYNDGTENTISSGYLCSPMQLNSTGVQDIKVEFMGISTEFQIRVNTPVYEEVRKDNNESSENSGTFTNPFEDPFANFTDPFSNDEYQEPVMLDEEISVAPDSYYIVEPYVDEEQCVISMTAGNSGSIWWYYSNVDENVSNKDYVQKYHNAFLWGDETGITDVRRNGTVEIPFDEYSDGLSFVYIAFQPDNDPNFTSAQITRISLVPYQTILPDPG